MKKHTRMLAAVSVLTFAGGASVYAQYGGPGGDTGQPSGMQQEQMGQDQQEQMDSAQRMGAGQEIVSAEQMGPEAVRQVQQALNQSGHDPGPVDGIWGPQTASALRSFQQSQGLEASGEINQNTLSALGLDTSEFAAGEFEKQDRQGGMENGGMGGDAQQQQPREGAGEGRRNDSGLF